MDVVGNVAHLSGMAARSAVTQTSLETPPFAGSYGSSLAAASSQPVDRGSLVTKLARRLDGNHPPAKHHTVGHLSTLSGRSAGPPSQAVRQNRSRLVASAASLNPNNPAQQSP